MKSCPGHCIMIFLLSTYMCDVQRRDFRFAKALLSEVEKAHLNFDKFSYGIYVLLFDRQYASSHYRSRYDSVHRECYQQ